MKIHSAELVAIGGKDRLLQWRIRRRKSLRHSGMENYIEHRVIEMGLTSVLAGEFKVNKAEFQRLLGQRAFSQMAESA